jgi:hypothetical protein
VLAVAHPTRHPVQHDPDGFTIHEPDLQGKRFPGKGIQSKGCRQGLSCMI